MYSLLTFAHESCGSPDWAQSLFDALVAAGICSQPQADALSALADASIPWTESVGLPEIGVGLVINARRIANG